MDLSTLTWLIPLPLFVAFGVMALLALGRMLSHTLATLISMGGVLLTLVFSLLVFFGVLDLDLEKVKVGGSFAWLATGASTFNIGVVADALNRPFLFMVPLACTLIFLYSTEYMAKDPRYTRFMTFLSLFAGSMMGLVVSDNLLTFFVFWELMGFCSYSLIGFFYNKPSAYKAAVKAFMTTRIGDMFLIMGMVYLYAQTGTLNFHDIMANEAVLEKLGHDPAILGGFFGLFTSAAGAIGVLIFGGTVGKSAQWPLHVWLPDAMEGPTPVSAMIHAAAMVSAGVLLTLRVFPILNMSIPHEGGGVGTAFGFIGFIGAFTALMAALIAVAQYDIKRVLAYSTISQLGFMVAAIGMGAFVAATFHLLTHAFFKALLFLGSGAVIHGVEHGHHHAHGGHGAHGPAGHDVHGAGETKDVHVSRDTSNVHVHETHAHADAHGHDDAHAFDPQDMRNMGGLRTRMPVTFWTFLIGGLALSGFPFITAGFWSKDEILGSAWQGFTEGSILHTITFFTLCIAATLTAFYTMRQIAMTFFGKPRTEAAAHASDNGWRMNLPLIILAVFALIAGFANIPKALGGSEWLGHGLEPYLEASIKASGHKHPHIFSYVPMIVSIVIGLLGLSLGYLRYGGKNALQAGQTDPVEKLPFFNFLHNRMYWDELYRKIFINPLQRFADSYSPIFDKMLIDGIGLEGGWDLGKGFAGFLRWFDENVVTGISNLFGWVFNKFGSLGRGLQTGQIQGYLFMALVAFMVLLGIYIFDVVRVVLRTLGFA